MVVIGAAASSMLRVVMRSSMWFVFGVILVVVSIEAVLQVYGSREAQADAISGSGLLELQELLLLVLVLLHRPHHAALFLARN